MVALGMILLAGITMVLKRSVLNGVLLAVCDMSDLMALISTLTGLGTSLYTDVYVQYFKNNFYISQHAHLKYAKHYTYTRAMCIDSQIP